MRLVINQPEPVSNIANPILEREVAARMTTKAEWPNTVSDGKRPPAPCPLYPSGVRSRFDC